MSYFIKLEAKTFMRKIAVGAMICVFMVSAIPTHVIAEGEGGVGFSDRDPSIPIYGNQRVLDRFRELIQDNPEFYVGLLLNYIRTGRVPSGFFSGRG